MNKITVEANILFFAFRYALGRRSYAPETVVESIKANINHISEHDLKAYIKEIEEANDLGDPMDAHVWLECKNYLQNVLNKR